MEALRNYPITQSKWPNTTCDERTIAPTKVPNEADKSAIGSLANETLSSPLLLMVLSQICLRAEAQRVSLQLSASPANRSRYLSSILHSPFPRYDHRGCYDRKSAIRSKQNTSHGRTYSAEPPKIFIYSMRIRIGSAAAPQTSTADWLRGNHEMNP